MVPAPREAADGGRPVGTLLLAALPAVVPAVVAATTNQGRDLSLVTSE
jgi:hypothetical protein